ncbi:uncharacterized protein MYCGRDRAFT_98124 [Zymoseptoria tritici IPO323]|uniref:Uncharacterized protein n=1 Tax=Zymoseptoria tritici (strain CBS 115943 / IPO323) TaxID=336722 RepID=F9XSD4_ZYMTI|nr:uncharacterized protein MYCGRDRAFT_98124 [Zymoseptoria tritici IPO323]EGP81843.1 hypothetical protein MYCGRDRAFT_98124 [Zymoseptoria tritici IPO323]
MNAAVTMAFAGFLRLGEITFKGKAAYTTTLASRHPLPVRSAAQSTPVEQYIDYMNASTEQKETEATNQHREFAAEIAIKSELLPERTTTNRDTKNDSDISTEDSEPTSSLHRREQHQEREMENGTDIESRSTQLLRPTRPHQLLYYYESNTRRSRSEIHQAAHQAAHFQHFFTDARRILTSDGSVRSAAVESDTKSDTPREFGIGVQVALGVAVLSWWMLLMTAAFFHTWFEKLTGSLVALTTIYLVDQHNDAHWPATTNCNTFESIDCSLLYMPIGTSTAEYEREKSATDSATDERNRFPWLMDGAFGFQKRMDVHEVANVFLFGGNCDIATGQQ